MRRKGLYVLIGLIILIAAGFYMFNNVNKSNRQTGSIDISDGEKDVVKLDFDVNRDRSNIEFTIGGKLSKGSVNVKVVNSKNETVFDKDLTESNSEDVKAKLKGVAGTWKIEVINKDAQGRLEYSEYEK